MTRPAKPTIDPHFRVFLPMWRAFGQPERSRALILPFLPLPTGLPGGRAAPAGAAPAPRAPDEPPAGGLVALRAPGRAARRPGPPAGGCLSLTGVFRFPFRCSRQLA